MKRSFGGCYAGRKVLVTGHTGFKGSWLCLWLSALGARIAGLALPPGTDPAHWPLLGLGEVDDYREDLRNAEAVRRVLNEVQPEIVFHLAAQALVRRSYRDPMTTFNTNIGGLVNLLEAVRTTASVRAVVNATTDKVYQDRVSTMGYREEDPLGGHDPYSTSKACAELLTDCYRKSFFEPTNSVRIATARAGNVIGGGDWSEDRLVPDLVRAATSSTTLRIRKPDAVRPWQHVLEPLSGYLRLGQGLLCGETVGSSWNFGPGDDANLPVQTLVERLRVEWPKLEHAPDAGPHPRETDTLRLDCGKAMRELAWRPVWHVDTSVQRTARWYRAYYERDGVLSRDDLRDYVSAARDAGLGWAA